MKTSCFLFLLSLPGFCLAYTVAPCPDASLGEVDADCPWATIARAANFETQLAATAPDLVRQIKVDSRNTIYKSLWGHSINYDELAKGIIVEPAILSALYLLMDVPKPHHAHESPQDAIQHAGLEHTYGYLFSVLRTAFGYKRARWVSGEIERGFGLDAQLLGPKCNKGTMFSNLTQFLGRIAFRHDAARLKQIREGSDTSASILNAFNYGDLRIERLVETVHLSDSVAVALRTDIVQFPHDSGGSNSALLLYSVDDPRVGGAKIISAFPVTASFADQVFAPDTLGENKTISTRYNAYVDGLTGKSLLGTRVRTR